MGILTPNHYIDDVDSFINNIKNSKNAYYVFTGHPQPWANSDTNIITPNNAISQYQLSIFNNILYGKLIQSSEVQNLIPRINWANNTYYDRYDQNDADLYTKQFYVMNNNYQVFKCINNNRGGNSTVQPTLTSPVGTFTTGDGYVWKYMFTVDSTSNTLFTSNNFIPCLVDANVQSNAVAGTIDSVKFANGGSNFQTYSNGFLQNFISSFSVQLPNTASPYDNFYTNSSIYLKAGFGAGQIRQITSYNGSTKVVTVSKAFDSYTTLNLANVQGSVYTGEIAFQPINYISTLYTQGYFNDGDSVIQSDTLATGYITSSNSSTIAVIPTSNISFSLTYPIKNVSQDGPLKPGRVNIANNTLYANAFSPNFNANSQVSTTGFITLGANQYYNNGDYVQYYTATGNTALTGLSNNGLYYVVNSNTTAIQLSSTSGGANIAITPSIISESGHYINIVLSNYYSNNQYIRVGLSANTNIRRVVSVNTSVITTDIAFTTTLTGVQHYQPPYVTDPSSIINTQANGIIQNLNLNSVTLNIANTSIPGQLYITGETVDMVNSANVNQGANGTVAYANSSTLILSNVNGNWTANLFVIGESSQLTSNISSVATSPSVTVSSPQGSFVSGQPVYFSLTGSNTGNAEIISSSTIPNNLTEYLISPTVVINGDGSNAVAYAVVNSAIGSANDISKIVFLNNGMNYSNADIMVYANSSYGSGANIIPIISPIQGHGYDPVSELNARYAGVTVTFENATNEQFMYPSYIDFRTVGIIENPAFDDVTVTIGDFDRTKLYLSNTVGTFSTGEIVINAPNNSVAPISSAAGVVVYSNSSYLELKNAKGTWSNVAPNNVVYGLTSNTVGTINKSTVSQFSIGSTPVIVSEVSAGATCEIIQIISNTELKLTKVVGQFTSNDVLFDTSSNAYANVLSIAIANGTVNVTSDFAQRFNQTSRFTLTSNTAPFQQYEYVNQNNTNASAQIISTTNEIDLIITPVSGSFSNGETVTDTTSNAYGYVIYANSTYLQLTGVNPNNVFGDGHYITNGLGANAQIANINPVLLLNDVSYDNKLQSGGNNALIGNTSGASGLCDSANLIIYPDLVRNTGKCIYLDNFAKVTKTANTQEQVKLVIKF